MSAREPTLEELHALADDRLEEARAAELRALLGERPQLARQVTDYQRMNAGLHAIYDPVLAEPLPARLPVEASQARRRFAWHAALVRVAACVVLLALGAAGGWYARQATIAPAREQASFVRTATVAHKIYVAEVRHPVEVAADEEEHLVRWLSRRIGRTLKAPKLEPAGFKLMGGRLLPGEQGLACQFMYEDAQGRRLTVYIRSDLSGSGETAFRYGSDLQGLNVFYWIDKKFGYALAGTLPREQLLTLARQVYEQLEM